MMKRALVHVCLLAVVTVALAACSVAAAQPSSVEVTCDEFSKQSQPARVGRNLSLPAGQTFTLTLCSNQTTGFQWEEPKVSDAAVLQSVDHKFQEPSGNLVGAAGKEIWTFKGLKKGQATVSVDYSRPWQGGEKGVWQFNLTVDVS